MSKINFKRDMIVFMKVIDIAVKNNTITFHLLRKIADRTKYFSSIKNADALKNLKANAKVIEDKFSYNIVKKLKSCDNRKMMSRILTDTFLTDANLTSQDVKQHRSYETFYDVVNYVAFKLDMLQLARDSFRQKFEAHTAIKKMSKAKKQVAKKQVAKKQVAKK